MPDLAELRALRLARDRMDREFAQPLTVADLARTAMMSSSHFSRRFRAAYDETPHAYLMTRRIERAKALLVATDLSVTDVSLAVGCSSLGSFSSSFASLVGCSPSDYRELHPGDATGLSPCQLMVVARPRRSYPRD